MNLDMVLRKRRSIRRFLPEKIPKDVLFSIIEAGTLAPTACNKQAWKFVVVDEPGLKKEIAEKAGSNPLIVSAPVNIFVFYLSNVTTKKYSFIQSASASIQNMLLKATELGLGSLWMTGIGDSEKIKEILSVPDDYFLVANVLVGKTDQNPDQIQRRPLKEVVSFNEFNFQDSYPFSYNPLDWKAGQLASFRGKSVWATNPSKDAFIGVEKEYLQELRELKKVFPGKGKILDVFPFAGSYSVPLMNEFPETDWTVLELDEENFRFLNERAKNEGIRKRIKFEKSEDWIIPGNEKFSCICLFRSLESCSDWKILLSQAVSRLESGGRIIILFRNRNSLFYLHHLYKRKLNFSKEVIENTGPFEPIPLPDVLSELSSLDVLSAEGISLFPWDLGKKGSPNFSRLVVLSAQKSKQRPKQT